jgi:hypothetical protein
MDWLLTFGQKVLAIPGLHAILAAFGVGLAVTHLFTLSLPAHIAIKTAKAWSRLIIFCAVMGTALALLPTPVMFAWAFTVAIMTPLFYEWLTEALYHWKPYLKPKVLLTAPEMQVRIAEKETK